MGLPAADPRAVLADRRVRVAVRAGRGDRAHDLAADARFRSAGSRAALGRHSARAAGADSRPPVSGVRTGVAAMKPSCVALALASIVLLAGCATARGPQRLDDLPFGGAPESDWSRVAQ